MRRKIDFMCVGVQKAGTSTLHDIIKQHPDVELPMFKETHFFNDDSKYQKGIEHYFDYYFKNSNKPFRGEIVPEYAYFSYCADRIFDAFGRIKIVFILRDPIERAYSHYLMTKRRGLEPLNFMEALNEETERLKDYESKGNYSYVSRGKYTSQIERFKSKFGDENVKIILFEDLVENTEAVITNISNFIGLPTFKYDCSIKSNTVSEPKSKTLRDFIHKPNKIKKTVGSLIPSKKIKDYVMINLNKKNLKPSHKEELSFQIKAEIYQTYFFDEIEKLESTLNLNLGNWKH